MINIIFANNIINENNMSKAQSYQTALQLAGEVGYDIPALRRQWVGTTTQFWRNKVRTLRNNIRLRAGNHTRAVELANYLREPLAIPNVVQGTSNETWTKELRRIRMRRLRATRRGQTQARQQLARVIPDIVQAPIRRQVRAILPDIRAAARRREIQKRINRMITGNQFQNLLNMVVNDNQTLTNAQAQRLWNNIIGAGRYVIYIEGEGIDQYLPVNSTTRDFILNIFTNGIIIDPGAPNWGSDIVDNITIQNINRMTIQRVNPERIIRNRDGRFFPYINTTELDLSKYQVFNQEQAYNISTKCDREHCLIHTLKQAGIENSVINNIKMSYIQEETNETVRISIRKKDLHTISDIIKRNIIVHTMNGRGIAKQVIKAKEADQNPDGTLKDDINMAMYENHYFLFEDTKYSKYSIINYEELKDEEDFNNIIKTVKKKDKTYNYKDESKSKINSLLLVDKFFKAQYFKKLDLSKFEETTTHKELKEHIYLDNIENEQRLCEEKEQKEKSKQEIYYADCESFVKDVDYHKLYLLGVVNDKSDIVDIYNVCDQPEKEGVSKEQQVVYKFFNNITKNGTTNALVYFHNLKYDYHLLEKFINIKDRCEKDGQLYNIVCKYKGKEIELRDSFKILPFALSKFGDEFDLPKEIRKKEAIAYNYYTEQNNNVIIQAKQYRQLLSSKEKTIFKDAVKDCSSYNIENKTFNPLIYYQEYLRLDCLVLKKGIQKFNELIQEITRSPDGLQKMNVYDSLTISSLTDKYMKKEGAYEGVYEVQGNLRAYIAQAVYGGRVCVNPKYKKKIIEGKISDYDGVSLYPSAINRLCRTNYLSETNLSGGLPKGKAKRFNPNDLSKWKDKHYSIMTVKITKVNKIQQMPFIAHKTEDSIKYSNTAPQFSDGTLRPIIIDSITLQDYIQFHQIEYELLDGVYWNSRCDDCLQQSSTTPNPSRSDGATPLRQTPNSQSECRGDSGCRGDCGGNKKMGEIIQRLFNARLQAKKDKKTALSNTIKLMLNSSYGKTIMKKAKTSKQIIKTETKAYNKKTKKWEVKSKTNLKDYIYNNFNTIKNYRKLNENNYEVEKTCADNSFNRGQVGCAILSISKRIMNEVFDVANDNEYPIYYTDTDSLHCNLEDVPRLEKAFQAKYNKELNGKQLEQFHTDFDLDGAKGEIYATKSIFLGKKSYMDYLESKDENGNTIHGFHTRLKGITKEGLEHTAKQYNNSYIGLYEELAKGKEKKIILNPYNPDTNENKVLFEFKEGKVSTKKEFTRVVKF